MEMKKGIKWIAAGISVLLPGMLTPLEAQSELQTSFTLGGGGEYNIFKSPDQLRDNLTGEYWDQDSLKLSDMMVDVGYDVEFTKEREERYTLSLGSDLWYRHYLNYNDLNQARLNLYGEYARWMGDKARLGILYNLRWSDRVGTSVTGDLLMRSFRYLGNEAMLYLEMLPSDALLMRLETDYEYKVYYDENTLDPLNHGNLEIAYLFNAEPSRLHEFRLELSFLDRRYSGYHALDGSGNYDPAQPLRHFQYYTVQLDYDWKPVRGFRLNPEAEIRRRVDGFEGYYSYFSFGGGLRIRYSWENLYVSLFGDYRRQAYDIREAFTSQADDPALVYGYLDISLDMKYQLAERWEIYLSLESDNRSSNSDLDYLKTRRGYKNYEALIGINYSLPDMKWR